MIAIVVPTLHRPEHLQALLTNAHAATWNKCHVYFVAESTDVPTLDELGRLEGGHTNVIGEFGSCAKAMNAGFDASTEPYVFTANDDLRFHDGWDFYALAQMALGVPRHRIVGTNDGHGRMTCFALVERAFIDEHSGVYDQPGTLYHEYASQYVDTELADYAKYRGVWGEAPDAITEHLHWEFGKADRDHPNYLKAAATCAADHRTYEQRRRKWEALPVLA